jgi:hypothetical protein
MLLWFSGLGVMVTVLDEKKKGPGMHYWCMAPADKESSVVGSIGPGISCAFRQVEVTSGNRAIRLQPAVGISVVIEMESPCWEENTSGGDDFPCPTTAPRLHFPVLAGLTGVDENIFRISPGKRSRASAAAPSSPVSLGSLGPERRRRMLAGDCVARMHHRLRVNTDGSAR